jgi:regulatory protein
MAEALTLAYQYLGKRDRTVAELRRHLEAKGAAPAAVDEAIATLKRLGYLDDARYARCFAEDRRRLDHWGAERIERRLLEIGVERDLVAAALADPDAPGELSAAVDLLRRRFPRALPDDRERGRALGVLTRKGYEAELAEDAIRAFEHGG